MKHLIVNADDYGFTAGVSAGIRRAYREGILTSTSALMTFARARGDLKVLASETPALGCGVHLSLTDGTPLRLAVFPARADLDDALAAIPAVDLREEWRAQIDAFLASGLLLTHLDSHHHAAYRNEKALGVLLELAREFHVPVRSPYPIGAPVDAAAARLLVEAGVRSPDAFVDVLDVPRPAAGTAIAGIAALQAGVTEFMVHPAVVDDDLRRLNPTFAEPRAHELAALTAPAVRAAIAEAGVRLVTFAHLHGPALTFHAAHPEDADALPLIDALSDTLAAITGSSGRSSFSNADMDAPGSVFVLARDAATGRAIGCGALRRLDDTTCELKRMFAAGRGRGVGSALLSDLEGRARELGYARIWLETRKINEVATRFYLRHGYRVIPNFGKYAGNDAAICFEKAVR